MIYVFLANGFEETEAIAPIDILRRSEVEVVTVGIGGGTITGSHGIEITPDIIDSDVILSDKVDMIVLPGGMPGTLNMAGNKILCDALKKQAESGKRVAAICAAPSVLGGLGLLKGKKATCYPGFEDKLLGADYTHEGVVTDGCITTARGLGYALDLGLELVRLLIDEDTALKLKDSIQYEDR